MRKRYMIWKDIHSFFRDFRSFLLLFLTPIFITVLVGSLFMSSGVRDIPIVVCSEETNSIYNSTVSLVRGSGVFILYEKQGDCLSYINYTMKSGLVRAGIIIPEIRYGSTIEIYVDNTKPIGTYLQSYFNLVSRDISNRLINEFIAEALSNIQANEYQISQLESALNSFDSELAKIDNDIDRISYVMNEGENRLIYSKVKAANIKAATQALRNGMDSARSQAELLGYTGIVNDMDGLYPSIDTILTEAGDIEMTNSSLSTEDVSSIRSSVALLRDHLTTIKGSTYLINTVLSGIREEVPQYSDPVKSRVTGFFGSKSYINFIFPSILIMIVMWMATFLSSINFIRQKNRGILRRLYISPMSTRTIAIEKITANTLISLIPLPFILFISFFLLGIEMSVFNAVFVFLAASLSVVIFAIIGLIIGSFSRTESTAILGSLIIIIPLMFMSGALYPVEAFPATIKMFTEFLPINAGIRLVEGFLFYTFDWIEFLFLVYTMIFYALFLSTVCWFLMRRSLKS